MQNNELIFLGANIKAQNILNVDEEYFTNQELKNFVIETKNILNGAKSDPGLQKILDKISTEALIEFENFCKDKAQEDLNQYFKEIVIELEKNTMRYKCCFSDLFDDRLAIEVDEQYVDTGIQEFNYYLNGGLQKKTLVGIQAATGKGKTTMLLTLGCNILKKGYNVAFVNLEMNEIEFNNNILSGISDKFSYTDIKMNNNLNHPEFREQLKNEILSKNIGKSALIINNDYEPLSSQTLEELILKEEKRRNIKFDVILIDYLFLLKTRKEGGKNSQGYEILQKVTQEAHKMSQRNNWAVLSVFQENRQGAKDSKNSDFSNMAGSFNALHDMDNYFKFYQDKVDDHYFVTIRPQKLRQFGAFDEDADYFNMEYNPQKKIYQIVNKQVKTEFTWKEVFDLPEVHEQLNYPDIAKLMESLNIINLPSSYQKQFSERKKKKNFKGPKNPNKSEADWKKINVGYLIQKKKSPQFYHNTTDLMNDDPEKLFEM